MTPSARGFLFLTALLLGGTAPARAQNPALPLFGHVFIVVEENTDYASVVGNPGMPYLNSLIARYGLATNYVADTHPSIDNYFMLAVGAFEAGNDSSWNCTTSTGVVSDDNIVRELLAAGKTWKVYAESIPATGTTGCSAGYYLKRHNPLAYLDDVADVPAQASNLVDFTGNFAADLENGTLPHYSFIVPNLINDAHSGTLAAADAWLEANIDPLVASPLFQRDGLLVIVFDEDANPNATGCTGSGNDCGGHVACVLVSLFIKSARFASNTSTHHENVLRLMAEGLGLKTFPGRAAASANMAEFFNAPEVSFAPVSLAFGDQRTGSTSAAQTVTLTNTGTAALTLTSIAVSSDFDESNNCGGSLDAGASCILSATFAPATARNHTGTYTINDDAARSAQTLSLTGTGTDFALAVAPGSATTATVIAGQTATYRLSLAPTGFSGTVARACTGAPAKATCAVSPASASPDGITTRDIIVSVTTVAGTMAGPGGELEPPAAHELGGLRWQVWMLVAMLVTSMMRNTVGRERKFRTGRRQALGVALFVVLMGLACGGGSVVPPGRRGTPAGTYTLTARAGSVSRSTALKVT